MPGLRAKVFAVEGSTPTGGTCPNDISDPIDQNIRTRCTLGWKIVVSERRSVIAASLNVGVRLIKPANLYMCTQNTTNRDNEVGRMAPGVRGHGSVPLSLSGNVVTRTGIQQHPEVSHKIGLK